MTADPIPCEYVAAVPLPSEGRIRFSVIRGGNIVDTYTIPAERCGAVLANFATAMGEVMRKRQDWREA